jgi:16S rRNA (cytosine1402-N4)-methyltransferase
MLKEVIGSLNLKRGYIVLDATIGGGGHGAEILNNITPGGRLIGLDADPDAIAKAGDSLKDFAGSFKLINANFRELDIILFKEEIKTLDAVFMDVGVSSFQMDDPGRGFSIKEDSRLDMRMDPRLKISAYDIVNRYKEKDIDHIIENFGEERFHRRISRSIAEARLKKSIETTRELAEIIRRAIGFRGRREKIDPATRTFQAIRIAVNDELGALEEGVKKAVSWLGSGRRICVISFHSLEDRIVKNLFRGYASLGVLKVITKKPMRPTARETAVNPRSRSGRLRVAEKV